MFKVNFMANQTVAAADINAIGENIAEAEYPTFADGVTYGVDALNGITAQMVTAGVKRGAGNNCAVSLSGTTVFISSGTVFFDCGAVMTIDSDGISTELEDSGQTNYVYLFFDSALNVAGARCTVAQPSGTDCVLLAEVTGTSVAQNVERFCKSRILDAPNTPLVVYNSLQCDGTQKETITETIIIPDLAKYAMVRITFVNGYYYVYYRSNGVDLWARWLPYSIFAKISPESVYGFFYRNTTTIGRFSAQGYFGNPLYIGTTSYKNAEIPDGEIRLEFDFENNALILAAGTKVKYGANDIKIELFAGEVQ